MGERSVVGIEWFSKLIARRREAGFPDPLPGEVSDCASSRTVVGWLGTTSARRSERGRPGYSGRRVVGRGSEGESMAVGDVSSSCGAGTPLPLKRQDLFRGDWRGNQVSLHRLDAG